MKIWVPLLTGVCFLSVTAFAEEVLLLKDELRKNLRQIESSMAARKKTSANGFNPDTEFALAKLMVEKSRVLDSLEEAAETASDELDLSERTEAREEAIKQLRRVAAAAPGHPSMDQIQLLLGVELRKTKSREAGLSTLKQMTVDFPNSPSVARAHLEIGRAYYEKKDLSRAIEEYKKVLDSPYASAGATAAYRLGLCENERGHFAEALDFFRMTLGDAAASGPALDNDAKTGRLQDMALEASLVAYAGLPKSSLEKDPSLHPPQKFYLSYATDKFHLRQILKSLEKHLDEKRRFDDAAEVSQIVLMSGGTDAEKLDEMTQLSKFLRNASTFHYSEQGLRSIIESLWSLEERQKTKELLAIEPVIRDLLTQAQRVALKTKRPEDYALLAHGYRQYLQIYPKSTERINLKVNLAESLYLAQKYLPAGQMYFEVAQEIGTKDKKSPRIRGLYDSGAHSYDLALAKPNLEMADRVWGQAGLRNLVIAYQESFPSDKNLGALLFNLAKGDTENKQYADAIKGWQAFLSNQPKSALTGEAAISLLDCYYKIEDFQNFVIEGKKWLSRSVLAPAAAKDLAENLRLVELKQVQKSAGDFASEAYAEKFLQLSKNEKDSALSETALLEAVMSYRASYNMKLYDVGLEYVQKYPTNPKSKEIHLYLIQAALDTVDLQRAINLMTSFSKIFPADEKSKTFPAQVAVIREQLGEVDFVLQAKLAKKDIVGAADLALSFGRWSKLWELSSQIPGAKGLYYHGVAQLRMGQVQEARETLKRAVLAAGNGGLSKEAIAHAGIVEIEARLENFIDLGQNSFSVANLQKLLALSKEISDDLKKVLQQESGRWSVAALAVNARLSKTFAGILSSAKPSAGMSEATLKSLIGPRIKSEQEAAAALNSRCLEVAAQNEIPSEYLKMCRSPQLVVKESDELKPRPEGGKEKYILSPKAYTFLMKDPKGLRALKAIYNANLNAKNYYAAYAVASRMTEVDAASSQPWVDLGSASLQVGLPGPAIIAFNRALKVDAKNPGALQAMSKLIPSPLPSENRLPAAVPGKTQP